jgi:hypothetical protein
MAEEGGKESNWWLECQGTGFLQRGKPRETGTEASSTRGRLTPRLLLRKDDWHEKEADQREDGKRSKLTHQ